MAVEDVVAERQRDRRLPNKITAYQERLGEPFGTLLYCVVDVQAEMAAVLEEPPESVDVRWRRDQQDFPDPRQHERRQRVVDHRLVVNREKLLGNNKGQRVEAGAGPAGKENPLHLASECRTTRAAEAKRAPMRTTGCWGRRGRRRCSTRCRFHRASRRSGNASPAGRRRR